MEEFVRAIVTDMEELVTDMEELVTVVWHDITGV